ncbi:hypothetical protein LCGC14_3045410, partial [marine sediment metagenome]
MTRSRIGALAAASLVLAALARPAPAKVTVLQQAPTRARFGQSALCRDTWISTAPWEGNRDNSKRTTLRCGGDKRAILIRFELATSVPPGAAIHKAVLRLADAGYPVRDKDGKFPTALE